MAVATKSDGYIHEVASLDADWNYATDFPTYVNGIRSLYMQFIPSGINDIFTVRNASINGPRICYCSSLNKFAPVYIGGQAIKPRIYQSDCTFNASADAGVIICLGGFSE